MEYVVEILRQNDEGQGIAKIDDVIVFVKNALIGEKVKIKITNKNKNYYEAIVLDILQKSPNRVEGICPYYHSCGGCNIMHMNYDSQLQFKIDRVKHIFKKLYNKDLDINNIVSDKQFNYRNKIVLRVQNNILGFYQNNTNTLFKCDKCMIASNNINQTIEFLNIYINKNKDNGISEIMIRECNNEIMLDIDNINNKKSLILELQKHPNIKSIYINKNLEYGKKELTQELNNLKFNISPKSFFQVNKNVVEQLYDYVLKNISNNVNALDLYCGTGTITSIISKKCKKVIGIEVQKSSIDNALVNIKQNNISNVEFLNGKVEDLIDKIKENNINLIVMDPPRSGSDKKTLKNIIDIKPNEIIYISCNPITLVRDLKLLESNYELKSIKLFDMFPNTYHVECVCVMELR